MPDNIYPDQSNDKFDIQYAPLLGLSSDIRASFGLAEDGGSPVIKTPDDNSTGHLRFGVAAEDAVAIQNRSFDLNGAYSFQLTQLGNKQFLVDPPNGLYQLGAIPVPGSDSGLSYTYLEIDDTTNKITLQAPEGILLPGYGYGNHAGTYTKFLAVDIGGNMIEVDAAGGGYTNLTQFVDQNNWKVFYSDGNGDVQELSIGASGDVLTSNGTSSAPSWTTPSGGSVTADNGLTMSTATNVQWGGTLLQTTTINGAAQTLLMIDLGSTYFQSGADITSESYSAGLWANGVSSLSTKSSLYSNIAGTTSKIEVKGVDGITFVKDVGGGPADLLLYAIQLPGATTSDVLYYDTATGQVTYGAVSGGGSITADNGLTASTATNVQLGGTLLQNTTIDATTLYTLTVTGNYSTAFSAPSNFINTNGGGSTFALSANGTNGIYTNGAGYGIYSSGSTGGYFIGATGLSAISNTSNGYGVSASSGSAGVTVLATSEGGYSGDFFRSAASTTGIEAVLKISRQSGGSAPAVGYGVSQDFSLVTNGGSVFRTSNQFISKWTDKGDATYTSQLDITGVTGASTETWLSLGQSGFMKLRGMNVTEAGAITPADAMLIYLTNTDGTFTSVGFWGYENGTWVKL